MTTKKTCDLCHQPFTSGVRYDAKTKSGPWGNLCSACFNSEGIGLGLGLGQRYELQLDGTWKCTEGSGLA